METKLSSVEFKPLEFIATVTNIWQIFDENGIKCNSKNYTFIAAALIIELRCQGLSRDEILFNFGSIYDLIEDKFKVEEK